MKSDCSAVYKLKQCLKADKSWLKFFTSAGIPMESSRTYAVTFSKNEIQLDMLSEIKKEYLVDMGITLMGHIIAILRHAKTVYEENVTTTTLSPAPAKYGQVAKPVQKEKPVVKNLPLRISNEKEDTVDKSTIAKKIISSVESRQRAIGTSTAQSSVSSTQTTSSQITEKLLPSKKKDSSGGTNQKAKISSIVANTAIKKKSTVESPIRHNDEAINSKGKVFERLGVEVADEPSDSPESSSSNESVFSRLGGKTSPTTYNPSRSPAKVSYKPAPNGADFSPEMPRVKRVIQNGNKSKSKPIMFTMRADEAEAQSLAAAFERRGRKRTRSPSPDTNGLETRNMGGFRSEKTVKARLGMMIFKTSNQKKVSFGPVSEQLIPLETKNLYRPYKNGRMGFADDFYSDYNGNVNLTSRSRLFNRFNY
uniref:SAM domain-containing protein n=1 Tax=Rhodnius prolixus TaxID=13249 RepID=T1I4B5_RHOPR